MGYRIKHPKLDSLGARKLVKILSDNKKGRSIVSVVKEGEEIWRYSPSRVSENPIRYYDYYTCKELEDYNSFQVSEEH